AVDALLRLSQDDFARLADPKYASLADDAKIVTLQLDIIGEMPVGVAQLYGWLLKRAERIAGAGLTRAFAVLMATSRRGLREIDWRALLCSTMPSGAFDDLLFARLRNSFRAHVIERGQPVCHDFFHAQMREAVAGRYGLASNSRAQCQAHQELAAHFRA